MEMNFAMSSLEGNIVEKTCEEVVERGSVLRTEYVQLN